MTHQLLAIISPDCCDFEPGLFNPVVKEFCAPRALLSEQISRDRGWPDQALPTNICVKLHLPLGEVVGITPIQAHHF